MHATVATALALLGALMPAVHAIPYYCDPGKPYNSNPLYFDDETSNCANFGRGYNYCCATFVGSGVCTADLLDDQTHYDLLNVVNQQLPKGSQFDTSTVGKWRASYTLFQDAAQNTTIEPYWFHSINNFIAGPPQELVPGGVSQVYFSVQGDDGLTQILVEHEC